MFINEQEAHDRLRDSEEIFVSLRNPVSLPVETVKPEEIINSSSPAENVEVQSDGDNSAIADNVQLESEVDRYLRGERYSLSSGTKRTGPLHDEVRAGIALTSIVLGSTHKGADLFDVNQTTALAHVGARNDMRQAKGSNGNLAKLIERNRNIVADKATARMLKCLDLLDDDKLENIGKPSELSRIAVDMSRIVEKVTPKDPSNAQHVTFHVFTTPQAKEEEYKTINITPESAHVQ